MADAQQDVLANLTGPADLRGLDEAALSHLATEIRELLITSVASNGGHLGPNLGVVELGIAIHRVFESPADRVVWDTGHQAYVHKMLTGRAGQFDGLRQRGRTVRLSEPRRVRARLGRELARLHEPVVRRRHGQGQPPARQGRSRRRRHRRRCPDRRHGLGSAQQHRRRQRPPSRRGGQRQRPVATRPPSAAWPTGSPRSAPIRATSPRSARSRSDSTVRAGSVPRRTKPFTRSRRASRTRWRRRGCSRISDSSTSARSTATIARPWSAH